MSDDILLKALGRIANHFYDLSGGPDMVKIAREALLEHATNPQPVVHEVVSIPAGQWATISAALKSLKLVKDQVAMWNHEAATMLHGTDPAQNRAMLHVKRNMVRQLREIIGDY